MKRQPQTREEKIQFIKGLMQGKTSPNDVLRPIAGVAFVHQGKVFAFQTKTDRIVFDADKAPDHKTFMLSRGNEGQNKPQSEDYSQENK
jgi:hypothetical protein